MDDIGSTLVNDEEKNLLEKFSTECIFQKLELFSSIISKFKHCYCIAGGIDTGFLSSFPDTK
jgi:hypothetical protein